MRLSEITSVPETQKLDFADPRLRLPDGGSDQRYQVASAIVPMLKAPERATIQISQVLHGETVRLHHREGRFALVQSELDGYVGWVELDALSADIRQTTHRVNSVRVHGYSAPRITARHRVALSLGARLSATGRRDGRYIEFDRVGWIVDHLVTPTDAFETDPVGIAQRFLGTPYLWGGRDAQGLDCSGLVQLCFSECGIVCPRDSDMQANWFGDPVHDWQEMGTLRRNDLIHWSGHIGFILDSETLLHANGTFMTTMQEPLGPAIDRIATEYGEPMGARRIDLVKLKGVRPDWLTLPVS